jgi:O-antigen/teichoic acid export membrane protein
MLSAQPITWVASFLTTILVPRYLGADDLGALAVAMTIAALVGTVATLGVPSYLTRRAATEPEQALAEGSSALVLLVGASVLAAALTAVVLPIAGLSVEPLAVLWLSLFGMVVATAQSVVFALLVGQQRHARFAWLNAMGVLCTTIVSLGVLVATDSVTLYFATSVGTMALITVASWLSSGYRLHRRSFDTGRFRTLVRAGLPFVGYQVALRVYGEIDRVLLALLSSQAVVGWYFAAYRIISIPVFIPTLITTPLLPALSRHADDPPVFQQTLQKTVVLALLTNVPISALIIACAPAIPGLLGWPEEFRNAVPLMMILAIHQPFVALDMVLGTALIARKDERRWFYVALAAAVFNPVLNLVLIPIFDRAVDNGAVGAAILTVATELFMLAGALALLPRGSVDRRTVLLGGRVICAGVCMWAVTAALRLYSLPLAFAGGCAAFAVAALLLRVVLPRDLRAVTALSRQMLGRRLTLTTSSKPE